MLASPRALRAPLTGVFALLLTLAGASAAITYSGIKNVAIPTNFAGIYLDFSDDTDASVFTTPAESAVVGGDPWDVNFFFSGVGMAYSPDFQPFIDDDPTPTNMSQILKVAPGTTIDSGSAFGQVLGVAGYGGSGKPAGSPSGEDHFTTPDTSNTTDYSAFTVGTPGYLAFVADVDGITVYGWMQVTFQNDGFSEDGGTLGTIHDWAWDDTAIDVGAIPEPGAVVLIVLGAAAFLRRQRG